MSTKKYYHYTTEDRVPEILKSKKITLATKYLNKKEKPCAWVSSNSVWENTAAKMAKNSIGTLIQLTFQEQLELFGCARIQVKPHNLTPWPKLRHVARITSDNTTFLEKLGKERGANPTEWFGSMYPIGLDQWIKIEIYKNGEWIEIQNFK
jgi:hypothetical protein